MLDDPSYEGDILELEKQIEEYNSELQAIESNIESTESWFDFVSDRIWAIQLEINEE